MVKSGAPERLLGFQDFFWNAGKPTPFTNKGNCALDCGFNVRSVAVLAVVTGAGGVKEKEESKVLAQPPQGFHTNTAALSLLTKASLPSTS